MNRGLWSVVGVAVAVGTGIVIAEAVRGQVLQEQPRVLDPPGRGFRLGAPGVTNAAAPTGPERRPARSAFQGTVQSVDPAQRTLVIAQSRPGAGTLTVVVSTSTRIQRQVSSPVTGLKVGDVVWIEETKPLSKQKRWLLVDKVGQAKG